VVSQHLCEESLVLLRAPSLHASILKIQHEKRKWYRRASDEVVGAAFTRRKVVVQP